MQAYAAFFNTKDFIPHGYCLAWSPLLLWLHVISDLLITLAYYSIPVMLVYFIRQRKDFPYPWLVALFAGFIIACGTTHLLSAITIWNPLYWLDGLFKGLTAVISLIAAVLMLWIIPRALSLPSSTQLQAEIQQKKAAEAALQEAFDRLHKIAGRVPGVVYQYHLRPDGSSCFPYASAAIREIYRLSPEDVREDASKVFAILHPDDYDGIVASIQKSARDLTRWHYEYRVKFDDGTVLWLLGNALPERQADSSTLWHGFITDITERKQIEEKLSVSHALNASILDSLSSHIAVLDQQGIIVAVNNAWRQFGKENNLPEAHQAMLGFNYLDACNNTFDLPDGNEANAAQSGIAAVLTGKQAAFHLEYPCHSPHLQRWFHMNVSPLQGPHSGVVVSHENITQRRQAEQTLRLLKAMIDVSLDGYWVADLTGNIRQATDAYAKMVGYSIDELVTMRISQLEAIEDVEQIKAHIAKVVSQGYDQFETRHYHKNGQLIDIEISAAFLPEFQQFCIFCRDITQRKHRERQDKAHLDQLAHVTRLGLMGEMASGIAHEVNQPLSAISSYTQVSLNLINKEHPDLAKLSEILAKTQQQALRAGQIIHRMREFVKSHPKHHASADINQLIHNCVSLCIAELHQNNIKLTLDLANNLPTVCVDHIQIEQIIINLIRNSIDALQNQPKKQPHQISIHSSVTLKNSIEVKVTDNASGLDEAQQQKILMPFYTTKTDGMGMGLSISRSLIEAHEGSLHFTSEPGKGSTFYFTLPIEPAPCPQPAVAILNPSLL